MSARTKQEVHSQERERTPPPAVGEKRTAAELEEAKAEKEALLVADLEKQYRWDATEPDSELDEEQRALMERQLQESFQPRDPTDLDDYDWESYHHLLTARLYRDKVEEMLRFVRRPQTMSVRQAVSLSSPDSPPQFVEPGRRYSRWFWATYRRQLKLLEDSGATLLSPHYVRITGTKLYRNKNRIDFMDEAVLKDQQALQTYCTAARTWLDTVSKANLDAFTAVFIRLPAQVREQFRTPNLRAKFATVPVLPTLIPDLGGRNDPQAPRLVRGWLIKSYAFLDVLKTDRRLRILSNVDYMPPLPLPQPPRRRIDGRFGPHEVSRYAQWHKEGRWHMAFIPTHIRGQTHELAHRDLRSDMAWYEADLNAHFDRDQVSKGAQPMYRAKEAIVARLKSTWVETERCFLRWFRIYGGVPQPGMPQDALNEARQSLDYLIRHELLERDVRETLAEFQRAVLEIRGYCEFMFCRSRMKDFERLQAQSHRSLPATDTSMPGSRVHARGVFTSSTDVADRIAQYGVPVWLVQVVAQNNVEHPPAAKELKEAVEDMYEGRRWDDGREVQYLRPQTDMRPFEWEDTRYVTGMSFATSHGEGGNGGEDAMQIDDHDNNNEVFVVDHDDQHVVPRVTLPPAVARAQPVTETVIATAGDDRKDAMLCDDHDNNNEVFVVAHDDQHVIPLVTLPPAEAVAEPVVEPVNAIAVMSQESLEAPTRRETAHSASAGTSSIRLNKRDSILPAKRKDDLRRDDEQGPPRKKKKRKAKAGEKPSLPQGSHYLAVKHGSSFESNIGPLPAWYPRPWSVATTARDSVDTSEIRRIKLADVREHPVPQKLQREHQLFLTPLVHQLAGAKTEGKISLMFATLVRLRPVYIVRLDSTAPSELEGFTSDAWQRIAKGFVRVAETDEHVRRLGLGAMWEPTPAAVAAQDDHTLSVEDLASLSLAEVEQQLAPNPLETDASRAPAPAHPASPASARLARPVPPSKPEKGEWRPYISRPSIGTMRAVGHERRNPVAKEKEADDPPPAPSRPRVAPSLNFRAYDGDDDDDDESEDEWGVGAGDGLPRGKKKVGAFDPDDEYFRQRYTKYVPRLAPESERYMHEPAGWRQTAPDQLTAENKFKYYLYQGRDEKGVMELKYIGHSKTSKKKKKDTEDDLSLLLETHDCWWEYRRGFVFMFPHYADPEEELAEGQRLTMWYRLYEEKNNLKYIQKVGRDFNEAMSLVWPSQDRTKLPVVPENATRAPPCEVPAKPSLTITPMAAATLFPTLRHLYERSTRWTGPKLGPPEGVALPLDDESPFPPDQELGVPLDFEMPDFSDVDGDEHAVKQELLSPVLRSATPVDNEPLPLLLLPAPATGPGTDKPTASTAVGFEVGARPGSLREILDPRHGSLSFDGHDLPAFNPPEDKAAADGYVWPPFATDEWRSYFAWDWNEIFFRYEVFRLDHLLRTTHTDIQPLCAETAMERQLTVCRVWNSDGFVPNGVDPLTHTKWTERENSIRAFHRLVRTWPRTELGLAPERFEHEREFLDFERRVWLAYAQTYYDYYGRLAPLPSPRPVVPWERDEHGTGSAE